MKVRCGARKNKLGLIEPECIEIFTVVGEFTYHYNYENKEFVIEADIDFDKFIDELFDVLTRMINNGAIKLEDCDKIASLFSKIEVLE